ncbi:caveolin-1-like [Tachypleus tridentatus]|uniref:caveolin-1-like n=1 Tax=Tachypleus tridentatus TaxID=6853 RepID=UPI003FD02762
MTNTSGLNLDNRDPNTLNEYLQVEFDDVIAEPEGTYSVNCVWKTAYKIFTGTKNCCYKFLTILCAFPIALAVGCSFAILSFQHIWCIGPALRHFRINCHIIRLYVRTCLDSCLAPCCTDMGLFFSRIRIAKGPGTDDQVV